MKQRVLVTGGAGFIGSHLCDLLLKNGYSVICLDNLVTGALENIKHNLGSKHFKLIKHDISKPVDIPGRIDFVLHFASPASPRDYEKLPIQTLKVGALGSHNALGIAKVKKAVFLLASTSEVYGDPLVSPQKESYFGNVNPVGPRSCYDEAKRFAEAITMAYHRVHKMDVRLIRIFNTYGPRMRRSDGRVIPNFIGQALAGRPLTVYGRGNQTRSFCYIDDLIRGILLLMRRPKGKLGGEVIFNLGNPDEFSIKELAALMSGIFTHKLPVRYLALPQDDPKQRKPDISRAKKILGWRPAVSLGKGLNMTISWFKKAS